MPAATDTTVTVSFDPTATSKQSDIIGPATPRNAGAMTAAQAAAIAALPTNGSYPRPTVTNNSVVAGAVVIDGSIENTEHKIALSANATLSITNPVAGEVYLFKVTNAGSFNITWPAAFKWPNSSPPVITPNGVDLINAAFDGSVYDAVASQAFGP